MIDNEVSSEHKEGAHEGIIQYFTPYGDPSKL
jgi:hypothetical protein